MRNQPYSIYEKLLPFLNQEDANGALATYIFDHLYEISVCSIHKLAKYAHVSPASVSRFIQKIGFSDYMEFRDFLEEELERNKNFQISHPKENIPFKKPYSISEVDKTLEYAFAQVKESFSSECLKNIESCAKAMHQYPNVYFLGLRSMKTIYEHVNNELLPLGKQIVFSGDMNKIQTPKSGNMIVLFTMHGHFFHMNEMKKIKDLQNKAEQIFVVSQVPIDHPFYKIQLKKCDTSYADLIVWMLLAEQLVYMYKF